MDYLIKNAYIVTQNNKREQIIGDIFVQKGIISYVGKKYIGATDNLKIINASGYTIFPGFINTHIHLGESIFMQCLPGKYSLDEYIIKTDNIYVKNKHIESKRREIAEYSALVALKSGTTTIGGSRVDNNSQNIGIRSVSGYILMKTVKLDKFCNDFMTKYKSFKNGLGKLDTGCLFIHSLNYINRELLNGLKDKLSKKEQIMIHIAETREQEKKINKIYGKSSIEVLDNFGLLTDKTILVHSSFVSKSDIEKIIQKRAKIIHCLSSNMKLSERTLDLKYILGKGIDVAIATDGAITSGGLDILQEAKLNYLYHNRFSRNTLSAQKVLDMITIDAAKVLGQNKKIGSIEANKKADMVFVKMIGDKNHIEKLLLYQNRVSGIMLDGNIILWKEKLLNRKEKDIVRTFNNLLKSINEQ